MRLFDTHAHYDDERFNGDRTSLLASMEEHGIGTIINVGASLDSAKISYGLSREYSFIYAALGVHPSDIDTLDNDGKKWIINHVSDPKVVAIGEIGLDYYWEKDDRVRERQREVFNEQLDIAIDAKLPVIIHSREACEDTFSIMEKAIDRGVRGVMHCFSYSPEIAMEYVKRGFYLGIGGVVTFKNSKKLKDTVRKVPLSSLLLETDCPYLAPEPFRGKRNDSTYLPYVVKAIAGIKEITEDEVTEVTMENARNLFTKVTRR